MLIPFLHGEGSASCSGIEDKAKESSISRNDFDLFVTVECYHLRWRDFQHQLENSL